MYAIAAHYVDVRRTSLKALALCKLQEMYNKPQSLFVSPLLQTELDFSRKKHCMLVLRIMVTSQKPVLKPLLLIPQNHEYDSENYIASFVLLSQKKLIIVLRVKNFRKTIQSVMNSVS